MTAMVVQENTEEQRIVANSWIPVTWEKFLEISQAQENIKAKFYYFLGSYYKEMGVGADHAFVNTLVIILIALYCMKKNILTRGYTNCSYRKVGVRECQPDISYYVDDRAQNAPQSSAIIDLDQNLPPDLVVEIADSSLGYDLGAKRMLYEELPTKEYWVIDVQNMQIIAFRILNSVGSERIRESVVLPGLELSLLEEALRRSTEMDNSQVGAWFMEQIA